MSREDEDQVDGNLKVRCKKLSLCSTFLQFNFSLIELNIYYNYIPN